MFRSGTDNWDGKYFIPPRIGRILFRLGPENPLAIEGEDNEGVRFT